MQLKKAHSATNNMRIFTQMQKLKCWCKWSLVSVFLVQKLTYHPFNSKLSIKVPNIIEPITDCYCIQAKRAFLYTKFILHHANSQKKHTRVTYSWQIKE